MGAARDPGSEANIEGTRTTAFGKYQLFASLGRGGMADVFLSVARGQMGFNKLAVVKRLRQTLSDETEFRKMFLDEARLAARLSHPNIVHTYEVGEQDGVYFIAMEYLEGQSLNKVIKETIRQKTPIDPQIAGRVIADALSGLGYAHDLRDYDGRPLSVIHRDVSPHNIFVTYDGHTKVVDFGIAKAALSSTETEVGVLKGKVAYMSPEQALGHRIDARSDLFAMGIVLWELIAQRRLMTGESAANTLHKLMNEPIPRLSQYLPDIDPTLDSLVARALEKAPERRFQSAGEMRDALESWLSSHLHQVRQEDVGRWMLSHFASVRGEVLGQIQQHMAMIAAAGDTPHLPSAGESLARIDHSSGKMSRQLVGAGGSESGVVANRGGPASIRGASPSHPNTQPLLATMPPREEKRSVLFLLVAIACFVLASLLVLVPSFRGRKQDVIVRGAATASASATDLPVPAALSVAPPEPDADVVPAASVTASASVPVGALPAMSTRTTHHPHTSPQRTASTPKSSTPGPAPEEPGFVTVSAYPWAKVTEGAKAICPVTPCNKVSMSPGTHTLTFENGESPGQKQTVSVQVRSGETATKNVGFK